MNYLFIASAHAGFGILYLCGMAIFWPTVKENSREIKKAIYEDSAESSKRLLYYGFIFTGILSAAIWGFLLPIVIYTFERIFNPNNKASTKTT